MYRTVHMLRNVCTLTESWDLWLTIEALCKQEVNVRKSWQLPGEVLSVIPTWTQNLVEKARNLISSGNLKKSLSNHLTIGLCKEFDGFTQKKENRHCKEVMEQPKSNNKATTTNPERRKNLISRTATLY